MKAIIHVNRQFIQMNSKDHGNRPVFTTKAGGKTIYSRQVNINGPCSLVSPGKQLSCGAKAWIETDFNNIEFIDRMTFKEAKESK